MPPLGTKLPTNRTKKPPSCDHCKQKRVLCHPNPAGCPRCVEKGIECTTTPVVRRKPATKRRKNEGSVESGTPSRSNSPRASTADLLDLPVPPATTTTSATTIADSLNDNIPYTPIPSTSAFVHEPVPLQSFDPFQLVSLQFRPPSLSVSPELAQHLFESFDQTPQHEHPIFATYSLERTLKTLGWRVDLLPPHANVLAHCVFAVGALLSFDASILDPYHLNFGGTCPTSFLAVLNHLPDLRKFGKLRRAACEGYREEALRRAKESDILFVASEEAATACHILNWLESVSPSGHRASAATWHAAEMSHLRILGRGNALPAGDVQIRWACYLLMNSLQALLNGQNPPSIEEQLLLVGPTSYSEAALDRELGGQKTHPFGWPFTTPHIVLALELCRRISEEMVGPWTRDQAFDFKKVTAILDSIRKRKRCASYILTHVDQSIKEVTPNVPTHHFPSYSNQDPGLRYQSNQVTAMRSFRTIVQTSWSHLSLVVFERLRSRQSRWSSEANDASLKSRLDFSVGEARELAIEGLKATLDSFENLAALAVWSHLVPHVLERWAQFVINETSEGFIVMDAKIVEMMEKLSDALKQNGYVWSSPSVDALIDTLDSQVLAFQIASSRRRTDPTQPPGASLDTLSRSNSDGQQQTSFDPTLSLFANISAISTPSSGEPQFRTLESTVDGNDLQTSSCGTAVSGSGGAAGGAYTMEGLSQTLGVGELY